MQKYFIWLDDERPVPENIERHATAGEMEIVIFRNPSLCYAWLCENALGNRVFISFDHDLGTANTGYDLAKRIVEDGIPLAGYMVHSMNPVGAANIDQILSHYGYHRVKYWRELRE
jgi:hypothetical protein